MRNVFKVRLVFLFALIFVLSVSCYAVALGDEEGVTEISSAAELASLSGQALSGNYKLTADIDLTDKNFKGITFLNGSFDGDGHTVTVNINNSGKAAFILTAGSKDFPAEIKNLTINGNIFGGGITAGIAANMVGTIENCVVNADIVSESLACVSGFASCSGKYELLIKDCVFGGTIQHLVTLNKQQNYNYFGIFLGYNGGAFGGGCIENGKVLYTVKLPASDGELIDKVEYFNCNGLGSYSSVVSGDCNIYTFDVPFSMESIGLNSIEDEGIMANYGSPVVRFTLTDGSYRYLDGFDKHNNQFVCDFGTKSFSSMYSYEDISDLVVTTKEVSNEYGITSQYSSVKIATAKQFESFAKLINSAVPAKFALADGAVKEFNVLNTLSIGVELTADIDLTVGDENGNLSEFCGIGKQEFFPYRAGIDGNGFTINVDIDAQYGYAIGLIGVASEMMQNITVCDLTVTGSINGFAKVGIVGYFDLVCNNYVTGGDLYMTNVENQASVSGYSAVGGLVGAMSVSKKRLGVYFDGCENSGDISLTSASGKYAGGLIGCTSYENNTYGSISVKDCISSGNISGTVASGASSSYLGGIAGCIIGDLSVFDGAVSRAVVTGGTYTGALIGKSNSIKTNDEIIENAVGVYAELKTLKFSSTAFSLTYSGKAIDLSTAAYTVGELSSAYSAIIEYSGETSTGESYSALLPPIEPGEYSARMSLRQNEGYYTASSFTPSTVSTCSFTIAKKTLNYSVNSVQEISYSSGGAGSTKTVALPVLPEGAEWSVSYYNSETEETTTNGVTARGEYTVTATIVTDELFDTRYDIESGKEYSVTLSVTKPTITVTIDSYEVYEGDRKIISYSYYGEIDGLDFDIEELEIVLSANSTRDMTVGSTIVSASGKTETENYVIKYVSGRIIVKSAATATGGCKNSFDTIGLVMIVLALCLPIINKKVYSRRYKKNV